MLQGSLVVKRRLLVLADRRVREPEVVPRVSQAERVAQPQLRRQCLFAVPDGLGGIAEMRLAQGHRAQGAGLTRLAAGGSVQLEGLPHMGQCFGMTAQQPGHATDVFVDDAHAVVVGHPGEQFQCPRKGDAGFAEPPQG